MPGSIDCLTDLGYIRHGSGGCLVVHDTNCLDLVRLVVSQPSFDCLGVSATAPVAFNELGLEAKLFSQLLPQRGEVPCLKHQDLVSG